MRDVQRFLASPWSIYSLNTTASSEFLFNVVDFCGELCRPFPLWEPQPRYALAHPHNKSDVTTSLQVR